MTRHPQLESARRKCIETARIKDVSIERLSSDLRIWSSMCIILSPKISTTWMKADLLWAILRHHNILSTLQFIRNFKQNLDVRNGLQRWNASCATEMESLVSTELHCIFKVEWFIAYTEAHKKAFSVRDILVWFPRYENSTLQVLKSHQSNCARDSRFHRSSQLNPRKSQHILHRVDFYDLFILYQ